MKFKKLVIYFDEGCGICKKVRSFLNFFNNGSCEFKFAKDMNFAKDTEEMKLKYYDLYSYDCELFFKGYATYLEIFKRLKIPFYPLFVIMKIKIIRNIGEKIYRNIADKRTCDINDNEK